MAACSPRILSCLPAITEALERLDVETARRIQAEERLHETEERFRNLSERAGKFLWISDPQTNELIYVSPGYEEVWARTREDSYVSPEAWANSFKRGAPRTTVLTENAAPRADVSSGRPGWFVAMDSRSDVSDS